CRYAGGGFPRALTAASTFCLSSAGSRSMLAISPPTDSAASPTSARSSPAHGPSSGSIPSRVGKLPTRRGGLVGQGGRAVSDDDVFRIVLIVGFVIVLPVAVYHRAGDVLHRPPGTDGRQVPLARRQRAQQPQEAARDLREEVGDEGRRHRRHGPVYPLRC